MESIDFFLSGLSVVLALFLLAVTVRAYRKSEVKMLAYLIVVFVVLLFDGAILLIEGFLNLAFPFSNTALLLASNIIILVLFYLGVVRGS